MDFKKYCISLSPGSRIDRELIEALETMPEDYRCLLIRQLILEGFKANKSLASASLLAPAAVAVQVAQPVSAPAPAPAPVARPVTRAAVPRPAPQPEPEQDEIIELPELAPALDALAEDDDDEDPMAKLRNILSKTA